MAVVQWDTLWQTTRAFQDSILTSPSLMTYSDGILYVVDDQLLRLFALDASTGAILWAEGRVGHGPKEFSAVSAIFPDRSGGVGIVDPRNRRVNRVDRRGVFGAVLPTTTIGTQPNQLCRLGEGRFLVVDVLNPRALAVDSSGAVLSEMAPFWPDLATATIQTRQVMVRNDPAGTNCFVGLTTGRGFVILPSDGQPVWGSYIEPFDVFATGPRQDEPELTYWAMTDGEIDADTVHVLFSGQTENRARVLDRYHARTGAYLNSFLLPFRTSEIAVGGGIVFAVRSGTQIIALRAKL